MIHKLKVIFKIIFLFASQDLILGGLISRDGQCPLVGSTLPVSGQILKLSVMLTSIASKDR